MWHALRTELAYFRPWLLGGLGIAAGVVVLLAVLLRLFGGAEEVPSFLPGMFAILAGMVVSFIAHSYRFEERRARLLLAGPLTPRQIAGIIVLLPAVLVSLGALAAVPMLGLASLVSGKIDLADLGLLGVLAGQFLAYAQMAPLLHETIAAHSQGRSRAAIIGWLGIILTIPVLIAFYWFEHQPLVYIPGYLIVVAALMAVTAVLYQGRTDFTR
jgi:hypothetical protein